MVWEIHMSCRIDVVDLVEVMSSQSHKCNPVLPAILYLVLHCVTHPTSTPQSVPSSTFVAVQYTGACFHSQWRTHWWIKCRRAWTICCQGNPIWKYYNEIVISSSWSVLMCCIFIFKLHYYDLGYFHNHPIIIWVCWWRSCYQQAWIYFPIIPSSSECVDEDHVANKLEFTLKLSSVGAIIRNGHGVYSAIASLTQYWDIYAEARHNCVFWFSLYYLYACSDKASENSCHMLEPSRL